METIIEDCAGLKFEKMAEIKFMFKKHQDDPEMMKERDGEIDKVKAETEKVK